MPDKPIAGRYEIREFVDSGGMGDVWRGYDAVLDRPVAVKLVRRAAVTSREAGQELAKRFQREARVTARIHHAGVPEVYDAVLDDSDERHLYLVMEFVEGLPLSAFIDPRRPLPIGWAVAVAAQVATVLSYAHEIPVVHRDLKPSNLLITQDGAVKVLDFGIAAVLHADATRLTATGIQIGTYGYMAPEQVRGARVSPRTDLYALGCLLHELLSGHKLFTGDRYQLMNQHTQGTPTALRDLRAEVPEALEALVLQLLLKAPEARPADAQEVYERLRPFLPAPGDLPVRPEGEGTASALPDPTRVYRLPYAPRPRRGSTEASASVTPPATAPAPAGEEGPAEREAAQEAIRDARKRYRELMEEGRFTQAAEVVGEKASLAVRALGRDNQHVLDLRKRRAVALLLGGDHRAALPEFVSLAKAYARVDGPQSENALSCRAQAARCQAKLGQATEALGELRLVLAGIQARDGDVSEEAVALRRDIGELLLSQGRLEAALDVLQPLRDDLAVVYGSNDEQTIEVAELVALIQRSIDEDAIEEASPRPAAGENR